ncbi:DUF1653 domain-containing protein [Microbacterium terregens]|uniref:DUF1653 domain-containing protein n=1 Tax=Microbacterium terregens TaxID=69363 RepID=A0ABV5T1H3_9MICO
MSAIEPGVYRHFKGQEYEVIGTARHSETEEQYVLFRPLYGAGDLWIRPIEMWEERVEREGYDGPRFIRVR